MNPPLLDGQCRAVLAVSPNGAVSWLMMASLLYYHLDVSIISDQLYDELAKTALENWDKIANPQKHIIGKEALKAGSCYHLKPEHYPMSVRGGAFALITGKGFVYDPARRREIEYVTFLPPEYCWDTYTYGEKTTWRQHQQKMIEQWKGMVAAGQMQAQYAAEQATRLGVTDHPFNPAPRIRQRIRVAPTGEA